MHDDSYQLVGKDQMEPSILNRRLRQWRPEDDSRTQSLVQGVLAAYKHNEWLSDPFRWETSVFPLFYFTKTRDIPSKAVYERIFEWAGHPSDHSENLSIENPSIEKMLGPVADAEVDLLIESANYFMFIEAKVRQKPGEKARFHRNKKEYGAIHQLVRQFEQGRLLASRINKTFMLATLGASDGDFVHVELRDGDRRLLKVVGQRGKDFPFPEMPNFSWKLLPE